MTKTVCTRCGAKVADGAFLCSDCTGSLERALGDVAATDRSLLADLGLTYTQQGRGSAQLARNGARTGYAQLGNDKAAVARAELVNALGTWARVVMEDHGGEPRSGQSKDIAIYLLAAIPWIRHQPWVDEMHHNLLTAIRTAQAITDRVGERQYAGPCRAELPDGTDCETELYVVGDAKTVTCPSCHFEWVSKDRHDWLLLCMDEQLLTAGMIAKALTEYGLAVTDDAIRGYAHRGRIIAKHLNLGAQPLYRVGDVIDVVRSVQRERGRRELERVKRKRTRGRKRAA